MMLPGEVRQGLVRALARGQDRGTVLGEARPVGGGCIHNALAVETSAGPVFVKWSRGDAGSGFVSEARSLEALREAADADGIIRVPGVIGVEDAEGDTAGWLALEYLPPSLPAPDHGDRLGRGLAALHVHTGASFGWPESNRIGSLPQPNPLMGSWRQFWATARLEPQIRAAVAEGHLDGGDANLLQTVMDRVDVALAPVAEDPPALLHGDLWSGNVHAGPGGAPVLVDPASYRGHGEVDLAMAHLFGGFPPAFFRAYAEIRPSAPGFAEVRRPLYQLYYLLVHVRLFGGSYLTRTRAAAREVLRGLA